MDWFDRFLRRLEDDQAPPPSMIRAFEIVLAALCATELWIDGGLQAWNTGSWLWLLPALSLFFAAAACTTAWRRTGFALLTASMAGAVWINFPTTGNHVYLGCFLCSLCAFLDPRQEEERRLLVRSLRWIGCVILFYAGVQKLIHGYYTNGLMPAFLLHEHRFEQVFGLLLPASEAQRIGAYDGLDGSGPYLVATPLWILASNLVWIFEIGLAVALFAERTRTIAIVLGIAFIAVIESGAREFVFGLIFVNLLLIHLRSDANRRYVPLAVLACLILLLIGTGWLPATEIH